MKKGSITICFPFFIKNLKSFLPCNSMIAFACVGSNYHFACRRNTREA